MTAPTYTVNRPALVAGSTTMALTLTTSPDNLVEGDLDLQNGQIHFWDKTPARIQKIRTILKFGLGEWYLNPDEGIPWFGPKGIIGSKNRNVVLSIVRAAFVKGLPDLASVRSLNLEFDGRTRAAPVTFELLFDDGIVLSSRDFGPLELGINGRT